MVSILEHRGPSLRQSWLRVAISSGSNVDRVLGKTSGSSNGRRLRKTVAEPSNEHAGGVRQSVSISLCRRVVRLYPAEERKAWAQPIEERYLKEDRSNNVEAWGSIQMEYRLAMWTHQQ